MCHKRHNPIIKLLLYYDKANESTIIFLIYQCNLRFTTVKHEPDKIFINILNLLQSIFGFFISIYLGMNFL